MSLATSGVGPSHRGELSVLHTEHDERASKPNLAAGLVLREKSLIVSAFLFIGFTIVLQYTRNARTLTPQPGVKE